MHSLPASRIAIFGGLGALASATFHKRFLLAWARARSAQADEDYPEIVHWSAPLAGVTQDGLADIPLALAGAERAFSLFRKAGVDFVAAPCNSLLDIQRDLEQVYGFPVLTPWTCAPAPAMGTAVLCSTSLRRTLSRRHSELVFPSSVQQHAVQSCIDQVVAGRLDPAGALERLVVELLNAGAPQVRIACTELSCIPLEPRAEVLDTMDCLVAACVQAALRAAGRHPLEAGLNPHPHSLHWSP